TSTVGVNVDSLPYMRELARRRSSGYSASNTAPICAGSPSRASASSLVMSVSDTPLPLSLVPFPFRRGGTLAATMRGGNHGGARRRLHAIAGVAGQRPDPGLRVAGIRGAAAGGQPPLARR